MTFQNFLEFKILEIEDYTLTPADLLKVLLYFVIAKIILLIINKLLHRKREGVKIDIGRTEALFQIIKYVVWTVAVVAGLESLGIDVDALLVSSAALFIGLGMGVQQIFRDFVSGIFLLFEGTIEVNDIVEIDGMVGKVQKVGFRTTEIMDRNEINIIVPNSKFVDNPVINWSHNYDNTRFYIEIGCAYGSDVGVVESALIEAAQKHSKVTKEQKPIARFQNFGDSALVFHLYFWTEDIFAVEHTKSEIRREIYQIFQRENISIPFPQRDIHIINK